MDDQTPNDDELSGLEFTDQPGPDMETISETDLQMTLIVIRKRAGLTQAEVHRRYGIDQSQLSDLENGRVSRPHTSTLRRLAAAYAENIPGAEQEFILQRLMEARERTLSGVAIDESFAMQRVFLRIQLHSKVVRSSLWRMVDKLLDELDIIETALKTETDDDKPFGGRFGP